MQPERDEAWAHVMHEHPVVAHYQKSGSGKVLRISDFLSSRKLRSMALYSEHYRPLGGHEDCIPILWPEGTNINAIGVHRKSKFTDSELDLMNYLRPHLVEAHANATAVTKLKRDTMRLDKMLALVNSAAVVLKPDRTLNFATGLARQWLAEYFGPPRADERLPEALDLWVRQHDASTRDTLRLPLPRSPLVIERERKRLVLRLLSGDGELAIVLEEQKTIIEPGSLGSLSLTRREREVLAHVANGHNNSETARALGIGTRTVETHMLRICERLGISSRSAAAVRAFQASRVTSFDSRDDTQSQDQINRSLQVDSEN